MSMIRGFEEEEEFMGWWNSGLRFMTMVWEDTLYVCVVYWVDIVFYGLELYRV